jgi:glycosyltransferase involved in cell wall biosynthesis
MTRPRVVAIIPAYNEEKTIGNVVRPLVGSPLVDEVFVISDGSTDKTKEVAEQAGARIHELSRTGGKGEAMMHAASHTNAQILAFFDADLIGLTQDHIEKLLLPVINNGLSMNVGIRDRGRFWTVLSRHLPLISGERAMPREIFEGVPKEFMRGFMVETALNYYCRSRGLRYGSTKMPGLTFRRKYQKVFLPLAVVQYVKMFWQVGVAMLVVRLARLLGKF